MRWITLYFHVTIFYHSKKQKGRRYIQYIYIKALASARGSEKKKKKKSPIAKNPNDFASAYICF